MSDPVSALQPTVQAWADIVLKEFDKKARALGIHEGALLDSFEQHVSWHSGGDIQRIHFLYEYYGKFVDMGVGRGVKFENRKDAKTTRREKPWFTKTFYKEVEKLKYIMAERLAERVPQMLVERIEANVKEKNRL